MYILFYMPTYFLRNSNKDNKKMDAITPKGDIVPFGDNRYSDYTLHKDVKRKELYDLRHCKNEDWTNLNTAGAWSKWILWNKPDIYEAISDMENRFKIKIEII